MQFINSSLLIFIIWTTGWLAGNSISFARGEEDPQILPYKTPFCGHSNPSLVCLIPCQEDPKCQNLGFNISVYSCACPAQYCPDGKIYGPEAYQEAPALTDEQLANQQHVKAACNGCVPAEIAPGHKQIGTCQT